MRTGKTTVGRLAKAGVAVLALVAFSGCGEESAEVGTEQSAGPPAQRAAPGGGDALRVTAGEGAGEERVDLLVGQMPSLERLRQALAGAPVNAALTRADRLEAAREWIGENADPSLTPREAELQAQMLAMYEDLLDAEDLSLAQATSLSESQLLGLWGMDADGDGRLSEEEALSGMGRMMNMESVIQEYFKDRFDTDGDGTLSPEESQAARELMIENQMPILDTMIERATVIAWDRNADGVVDAGELAEGEARLNFQDFDGNGEIEGIERVAAYQPLISQMGQAMTLLEQPDPQALQVQIEGEVAAIRESLMPLESDFDADGDGAIGEIEREAYRQAVAEAQQEIQARSMEVVQNQAARFMVAQFDIAVERLDTNGDGLLLDEEWEAGYGDLRVARDRKLFGYLYDADGDGGINDAEVARFMDSYEARSPYADADLNGRVDAGDLRHFLNQVSLP